MQCKHRTGFLRSGLLFGLLAVACVGAQAFVIRYDPTPAPVNVSSQEITAKLASVQNSLFFIYSSSFFGRVIVEADSYHLPNGAYAQMTFAWKTLVSTTGVNVLRQPTPEELKKDSDYTVIGFVYEEKTRIYVTDTNAKLAFATGNVRLRVPAKFAHVAFAANEVNIPRQDGPLNATLLNCKNDTVTLALTGQLKDTDVFLVLRDAAGQRLLTFEPKLIPAPGSLCITHKFRGTAAKVELFIPTEYVDNTLEIVANADPDFEAYRRNMVTARATRFARTGTDVPSAEYNMATLTAQTRVVARRNDILFNLTDQEIAVMLPRSYNSAFARVAFSKPVFYNPAGGIVESKLGGSMFDIETVSMVSLIADFDLKYAVVAGTAQLRYPAKLKVVTLTPTKPSDGALQATFQGSKVILKGEEDIDAFLPEHLAAIRAYDADGRQLKQCVYNEEVVNGEESWRVYGFWGIPAELRIVTGESWLTLDLPYRLAPAP